MVGYLSRARPELRRRRRFGGSADALGAPPPPPPPPPGTQFTSMAWRGEGLLAVTAGGLANNAISYLDGLYDFRADDDLLVTTANGAVATLTSAQSLTGTLTQGTGANQPAHSSSGDNVAFASASETDLSTGDWLVAPAITTWMAGASNRLGVAYMLVRRTAASHGTTLFRVGANNATYTRETGRAYRLRWGAGGNLQWGREGDTSGTLLELFTTNPLLSDGTWYAIAAVLNDDRDSNGTSDQISRLFVKSTTDPNYTTMFAASTAATTSVNSAGMQLCEINRSRWNNNASVSGIGTSLEMHSFGFDRAPPITNAAIENNLDKLRARV